MKERIDTLFARNFGAEEQSDRGESSHEFQWQPAADVWESDDDWHLAVDVPGVDESSLALEVDHGKLVLTGSRTLVEDAATFRHRSLERPHGGFRREFEMPEGISTDQIGASLRNGVLEVVILKTSQPVRRPVKIEVRQDKG
jgi:HSP20 family protein